MQLLEVLIWPRHAGFLLRRLSFAPGKVNVILGPPGTGKSSVWSIVDFCLGSSALRVPVGVTRDCSTWFGARFVASDRQILLARPHPDLDGLRGALVLEGPEVAAPVRPESNRTVKELKAYLDDRLTRFQPSNWGRVSCRDVVALNVRPQHLLSNPTAVLFDERNASSLHKIRVALPRLTHEDAPAELSSVRSSKATVETLGARARKASDQLVFKTFELYTHAQRLGLCPQSPLPRDQWRIGNVIFELRHALRQNEAFIATVDAQLSAPHAAGASAADVAMVKVVMEEIEPSPSDDTLYAATDGNSVSPRTLARAYTLGAIRELLAPTENLLSDLRDLRHRWRSLNVRLQQLRNRGADNYVGLTGTIQKYAQIMRLDYCQVPILLEERTLNLKFELGGRKALYLANMGGIRNYAGYGLALLLALHQAIDRQGGLGVGRFLFVDEMSQAFASKASGDEDGGEPPLALALSTLFDACETMAGRFQVVLLERELDAALLNDEANPVHVVEDWRGPHAGLIPYSWRTHEA